MWNVWFETGELRARFSTTATTLYDKQTCKHGDYTETYITCKYTHKHDSSSRLLRFAWIVTHTHTHFNCDYRQTMTVNGRLHQSQFLVCWQSGDYLSRDTGSTVEPQMVAHLWASKNSQPVGTSRVCQTFSKFPPFVLNISKMHFSVLTEQPNFGIKKKWYKWKTEIPFFT